MYREGLLILSIILIVIGIVLGFVPFVGVVGTILFWVGVVLIAIWIVLFAIQQIKSGS